MNRYLALIAAAALAAAVLTTAPAGASTSAGGGWGKAEPVPGLAAIGSNGNEVLSVSCASAGNCSAGGFYFGSGFGAFVVSQVNGAWGKAEEVPVTARLSTALGAEITSVSCASAGNCSAGGDYLTGNTGSEQEAFVVSQVHGIWGKAEEAPGTATLNTAGGSAEITSLSCASAGNCSAGGYYFDGAFHLQAFVVSQVHGIWGKAEEVPGTATLNTGGAASVNSLSCASAGNCGAGGTYADASGHTQAFVVSQVNGAWRKAEEVPGTATLNTGGAASVNSLSCGSAGNCSAGGTYIDASGHTQAFVVSQVNGAWGKAEEVPGTATLNTGGRASVDSVSCASAGDCSAGGDYTNASGQGRAFVVSRT